MRLIKIRWNKRATHLLRLLISLSLLLWLGFTIRWPELEQALLQVEAIWLLAAAGLVILSMLISVRKWQVLLQAQGMSVPWVDLWKAYWVGMFFNNFLPSSIGGDAVRILWVGKRGRDVPGAAASVIMERIIATAGLALTGFLGAGLLASPDRHALILFGILLAASLVLAGLVLGMPLPAKVGQGKGKLGRFPGALAGHGRSLRGQGKELLVVLFFSVVFQVTVVAVNVCIFKALRLDVSMVEALFIIPVTSAVAMIPLGVNGYGLREGAYVAGLSLYHISSGAAFTSSILFAFLVSLCSLYGGLVWLIQKREGKDVRFKRVPVGNPRDESREQLLPGSLAGRR